jgi:hypothetical protein
MFYQNISKTLSSIIFIIFAFSCKKFVDVPPPNNQITNSAVFSNDATAISAVAGIYSKMMGDSGPLFASGSLTIYPGLSADEIIFRNSSVDEFSKNSLTTSNTIVRGLWNSAYQYIYYTNNIIEGLNSSSLVSESLKNELIAEVKFIRAFCYFYLINLFGDVPLVLSADFQINKSLPRTSVSEIYQLIIDDLIVAEEHLPAKYISNEKHRPNNLAAASLLARIYLFQKNFINAEKEASKVINSGLYSLTSVSNVFLKNSSEAIWQLIPVSNGYTWEAYFMIPSSGTVPNYQLTNNLLSDFETNDLRKTTWVNSSVIQGQTYYFPYKYKSLQLQGFAEYYTVLRLGEQYLIRAESRAEQGNLLASQSDLNIIRNRAGLRDTTATDKQSILTAIAHEKRIELFAEWGHRWLDLKRTNRAESILSSLKGSFWQITDQLYPIPQLEIQNNPSLSQNPGY